MRRTAHQRGYDHRWRKESKAFLAVNPWCALQRDGCTRLATLVDHIDPHRGDMVKFWNRENWQGLCGHCHSHHKQLLENRVVTRDRRGRLIPLHRLHQLRYSRVANDAIGESPIALQGSVGCDSADA